MVIMSMEIYESAMKQLAMYRDIEISEKQIEAGQVKDARQHSGKRGQSMDYKLVISEMQMNYLII